MATQEIKLNEETSQEARMLALGITNLASFSDAAALLDPKASAVLEEAIKILYALSRGVVAYSSDSPFLAAMVYQNYHSREIR